LQEAILNAENNFKSATKDVQNLREVVGLPASKNENDAAPMKVFTDFKKELAALVGENDINNETLLEAIITYATWVKENQLAGHFARIKNLETNMKKLDSTFEVQVS
jgi:predicted ATPase